MYITHYQYKASQTLERSPLLSALAGIRKLLYHCTLPRVHPGSIFSRDTVGKPKIFSIDLTPTTQLVYRTNDLHQDRNRELPCHSTRSRKSQPYNILKYTEPYRVLMLMLANLLLQLLDFAKIPEWHSGLVKSITPVARNTDNGLAVGTKLHCVMEDFTFDSTITVSPPFSARPTKLLLLDPS